MAGEGKSELRLRVRYVCVWVTRVEENKVEGEGVDEREDSLG